MDQDISLNIELLQNRNPSEIGKFVNQYSDKIYNVAYSYLANREDAEEITQDVFLASLDGLKSFKKQSSLSTWIYRITINKCKDKIKFYSSKKRNAYVLSIDQKREDFHKIEPVEINHPGIQLESQEQMDALFKAIHSLPERQKAVLIMNKIEGLPQKQVAEILDMNIKAVESLLFRAKAGLRKELDKSFEEKYS